MWLPENVFIFWRESCKIKIMANKPKDNPPLTARALQFVDALLADPQMNQGRAAVAAGYSVHNAMRTASNLMQDPRVKALIKEKQKDRIEATQLTAQDVFLDLYRVAKADPRELTEYHVGACRYCHGTDFRYQFKPSEYRAAFEHYCAQHQKDDPVGIMFKTEGGVGYDARKKPHPNCPECHGYGVGRTIIKDTRTLSKAAATLFAGVKETKHGVEVITRNRDKAIEMAARHAGVDNPLKAQGSAADNTLIIEGGLPDAPNNSPDPA